MSKNDFRDYAERVDALAKQTREQVQKAENEVKTAAEAILRNAVKLTEIVDVERQITELENLIREIEQR